MEILKIENLKKGFDGLHVIKDVSLTVNEGEVVSVIGPSGGGKSTLLRCATLLERMDGGSLSYMGRYAAKDVNGVSEYVSKKELRELRHTFGLVFQNFNLFPHYTVLKNITDAPVSVDGVPKKEAEEKAFEWLQMFIQARFRSVMQARRCSISFSQDKKFRTWRKLWIALAETEMELGLSEDGKPVITQEMIDELKMHAPISIMMLQRPVKRKCVTM